MNRNNPYSVPQDYFSDLKKGIVERAKSIEQRPTEIEPFDFEFEEQPPISWGRAWRQMIGFAAAFALLVGIGWIFVYFASDGKVESLSQAQQDAAIFDTARILWVLEEQDVVSIVEHHQNEQIIMAKAAAEYFAFFGEADDVNLIIYD